MCKKHILVNTQKC